MFCLSFKYQTYLTILSQSTLWAVISSVSVTTLEGNKPSKTFISSSVTYKNNANFVHCLQNPGYCWYSADSQLWVTY